MEKTKERWLKKIDKTATCWLWAGATDGSGYGKIIHNRKIWAAHRLGYVLYIGEIPPGMCVCHKCDNPLCVKPGHMFLGTHKDNVNDCIKKGRSKVGVYNKIKTHCSNGHSFDEKNTRHYVARGRKCRACKACGAKWQKDYRTRRELKNARP